MIIIKHDNTNYMTLSIYAITIIVIHIYFIVFLNYVLTIIYFIVK